MLLIKSKPLRRLLRILVPFVLIPAVVLLGALVADESRHLAISFAVAICALLLFFAGIEQKKIGTRRLVIVAVMTALCVVGRFIPFFKPVTALTVITAIWLGGESGFLVGSMAALLSNFSFGQGPWTPFQMLAWGLVGLFAGMLARPLKKSRPLLLLYGVLSGVLFSLVMDIWTAMWYANGFDASVWLASVVTAIPHTALYAISNLLFLWFLAKPFGEKLERIKRKYGI